MLRLLVFFVGLFGVVSYFIYFTGPFIIAVPTGNIFDVIGKIGLMVIFCSWIFARKEPEVSCNTKQNRLLRKNLFGLSLFVLVLLCIYSFIWPPFVEFLIKHPPMFNLSVLFNDLPFNDFSWLRDYSNEYVSKWFRLVYFVGFVLPILFPCLICFLQKRYLQGWYYIFSGHIIQLCLAVPFYFLFSVDEIWIVKHIPDGLLRVFPDQITTASITMNNFPSLHTSVAFASLLVAQRETDIWLRFTWSTFCSCVIISTFYFPIHWMLDVIGGLILGWISVYLSRKLLFRFKKYTKIFLT